MNKIQFLKTLESQLTGLSVEDRNEILYDYEEHFRIGVEQGKTEEQVAEALGDPLVIAGQFGASIGREPASTNEIKTNASDVLRRILAFIGLAFFNLVIVLGPFLAFWGVLIGLFAAAIGVIVSGLSVIAAVIAFPVLGPYLSFPTFLFSVNPLGPIALGVGLAALGLLFFIGDCYLAKLLTRGTIKYLQMNIRIINGGGR